MIYKASNESCQWSKVCIVACHSKCCQCYENLANEGSVGGKGTKVVGYCSRLPLLWDIFLEEICCTELCTFLLLNVHSIFGTVMSRPHTLVFFNWMNILETHQHSFLCASCLNVCKV